MLWEQERVAKDPGLNISLPTNQPTLELPVLARTD